MGAGAADAQSFRSRVAAAAPSGDAAQVVLGAEAVPPLPTGSPAGAVACDSSLGFSSKKRRSRRGASARAMHGALPEPRRPSRTHCVGPTRPSGSAEPLAGSPRRDRGRAARCTWEVKDRPAQPPRGAKSRSRPRHSPSRPRTASDGSVVCGPSTGAMWRSSGRPLVENESVRLLACRRPVSGHVPSGRSGSSDLTGYRCTQRPLLAAEGQGTAGGRICSVGTPLGARGRAHGVPARHREFRDKKRKKLENYIGYRGGPPLWLTAY